MTHLAWIFAGLTAVLAYLMYAEKFGWWPYKRFSGSGRMRGLAVSGVAVGVGEEVGGKNDGGSTVGVFFDLPDGEQLAFGLTVEQAEGLAAMLSRATDSIEHGTEFGQ